MCSAVLLFEETKRPLTLHPGLLFSSPIEEVLCDTPGRLLEALRRIDALRRAGYYLAGSMSYEAGYFLRGLPERLKPDWFPLVHFFAFKAPKRMTPEAIQNFLGHEACAVQDVALNMTETDYARAFDKLQAHITAGDTYQVNFTAKYQFRYAGATSGLYRALRARQRVRYSAYFDLPAYQILSLSPELFFKKAGSKLFVNPMKGTMPRGEDNKADKANALFLTQDEKSRAENTMIVDLLRNDLSAISIPGSVNVSNLLSVESYETVHQMTSSIESEVQEDINFEELIHALFPCGSITGVPKRRTMELIEDLEYLPRRVYTGAMGYITPENDMCFNVPIRTLLCRDHQGELGAGGGILHDSVMKTEFEELMLKAQFFTGLME